MGLGVLCEDIVSAHKIGQVCKAIPLFGTRIFPSMVPTLIKLNLPVVMWLDKDQDSHSSRRAAWLAMVTGLPVKYVSTDKDPKAMSVEQIKEICESSTSS